MTKCRVFPPGSSRSMRRRNLGMFLEPGFDLGMPVRTVVVHDQVQGFPARKFAIHAAQKLQEFLMPVPLVEIADDLALQQVEGLNLALLVDTEHDGLIRWIEVESHHIGQLFQKLSDRATAGKSWCGAAGDCDCARDCSPWICSCPSGPP